MNNTQIRHKCGYCGWLFGLNTNFIQHQCFKHFVEDVDRINVDENYVVTILQANEQGSVLNTTSKDDVDELLISIIEGKPALYNCRIPASERTQLKKNALWKEVSNTLGGLLNPGECKVRWKYLRDNFIKARKKIRTYVPSGSAASGADGTITKYKFYDAMRFLDDFLSTRPTTSSLQDVSSQGTSESMSQEIAVIPGEDIQEMMNDVFFETTNEETGVGNFFSGPSRNSSLSPQPLTVKDNYLRTPFSANRTIQASTPANAALRRPPFTNMTPTTSRLISVESKTPPEAFADGLLREHGRPTKKQKSDTTLHTAFIEALKEPMNPAVEPVEGFLIRLGEGMRRLPYRRRAQLEIQYLTLLAEAEDELAD